MQTGVEGSMLEKQARMEEEPGQQVGKEVLENRKE